MASPQIQEPVVRPHQTEHFNRILDIIDRFYFYVDGSDRGTGKTHLACAVARARGLPMLVICPSVAKQTWMEAFQMYGMQHWNIPGVGPIITYDSFRSTKGHQPKHGLLMRDDSGESPMFYPTASLAHIIRSGVFIVLDECQKVKNNNAAHKALKAVIQFLYTGAGQESVRSRIGLLSGTVIDKEEQAVHFMRMTGLIDSRTLYTKINGEVREEGIAELKTWARRVNPTAAEDFIRTHRFVPNRKEATDYAFQIFRRVIRPHVMSIMKRVVQRDETGRPTSTLNIKNGFYLMEDVDAEEYQQAIQELAGAVRFNARTGTVDQPRGSIGAVTNALTHIQRSKIRLMIRLALADLNLRPENNFTFYKVIIFADYFEVIDQVKAAIATAGFNVLELTGRTSDKDKPTVINRFVHDDTYRFLIANPIVGGMSVNLQNRTARWGSRVYIMPGYRINELHQASGRTDREGAVGEAYVRFVYGLTAEGNIAMNIYTAMARKGRVMSQMMEEQGSRFPGEYENEYEVDPRTRFGEDFFTRNRVIAPAGEESSDEEEDIAAELEELNLEDDEAEPVAPAQPAALPLSVADNWTLNLPRLTLASPPASTATTTVTAVPGSSGTQ
jgi:hypothetical protein